MVDLTAVDLMALLRAAVAHEQAGRVAQAEGLYREILGHNPDHVPALHHFGLLAAARGRPDIAAALIGRAAELAPDDAQACNNAGNMLAAAGRLDEALASHRRTVALHPGYRNAYVSLANALSQKGRLSEAIAACRRAIGIDPEYWQALSNLGNFLNDDGRVSDAIAAYRAALALHDEPAIRVNLGHALLSIGLFEEGWRNYGHRQALPMQADRQRFVQPRWHGEAGAGRTLLIQAEQGLGDTLQFCRYVALAAARGFRIVFQVQAPLVRLFRGLAGPEAVVAQGQPLPPFDLHCPLLSLPGILDTRLDTIPAEVPYLRADPDGIAAWGARLAARPGLRVGLTWAGNPQLVADNRRSISPERLAPLLACPGVTCHSLQKDAAAPAGIIDLTADIRDFADTAAFVANLDLIVSVDTSVAHLAGAMGKPVWLLNRFDSDWRWLRHRDDSPWYPTLRQFRQAAPGDWDGVIARVRAELARMGDPTSSHWQNDAGCSI